MRPRIRTIKPEFFADERVVALSRDARLLLIGLVTMADDEGRFRARRSGILGHVFPGDDDAIKRIDTWIQEVQGQGIILFYVVDGTPYGAFRHWKKHQKISRPRPSDLPPPPDDNVIHDNSVNDHGVLTESSVNGSGGNTEGSLKTHPLARGCAFRSDPIPIGSLPTAELKTRALCQQLAGRVAGNDPKATTRPDSDRWQTDMRLLVEDRGGGAEAFLEVERVIDWCQSDAFWRCNILSPAKLRKQFTQLALKSAAGPLREVPASGKFSEYDRAAGL